MLEMDVKTKLIIAMIAAICWDKKPNKNCTHNKKIISLVRLKSFKSLSIFMVVPTTF
jgi:hypothetical protein